MGAWGPECKCDHWLPSCWKVVAELELPKGTAGSARGLEGSSPRRQPLPPSFVFLSLAEKIKEHLYYFLLAVKLKVLGALTELC